MTKQPETDEELAAVHVNGPSKLHNAPVHLADV